MNFITTKENHQEMNEDQLFPPDPVADQIQSYDISMPTRLAEDPQISQGAKVLYAIVKSYTRKTGQCYAKTATLAEAVKASPRSVQLWLAELAERGYIVLTLDRNNAKRQQPQRIIAVPEGTAKNVGREPAKNAGQGEEYNNSTPDNPPKGERATCFSFSEFWDMYGKKLGRAVCEKKYAKIGEADRAKIKETLPRYIRSTPRIQYRLNPQTYLNGRRWEDEIPEPAASTDRQDDPSAETYRRAEEMRRRWQE